MEQELRFRGGVRFTPDDAKWHIIIEVNGTQYLDETQYDTEEEATVVYRATRDIIREKFLHATGRDLQFSSFACGVCKAAFATFDEYDKHLPCKPGAIPPK